MKITEIYKELDECLDKTHPLRHRDIETWTLGDWNALSELTQELVRRKKDEE